MTLTDHHRRSHLRSRLIEDLDSALTMSDPQLRIAWKHVALGATLTAVSSLAALAVSVSITDADTLSTVALALAILAFVIQIMMFIAQSWVSDQQASQTHAINAETMSALAELRTRAAGTQDILAKQADTAMRYAFERQVVESRKLGLSTEKMAQSIDLGDEGITSEGYEEATEPSEEDVEIMSRLWEYPDEQSGVPMLPLFVDLSPIAGSTLKFLGEDELDSRRIGVRPGVRVKAEDSPGVVELMDRGLIEWVSGDEVRHKMARPREDDRFIRLTPTGREVARFLTAAGRVPEYLADAIRNRGVVSSGQVTE